MNKVSIGQSEIALSQIIYGVWRLSDAKHTATAHIREKIDLCLSQGITSFDHADIYGDYRCEEMFGQAIKEDPSIRHEMQLISKCDIALLSAKFPQRRVKYYDTSPQYITASVEQSLHNLGTDYLDLLLLHRPDPLMDAIETASALDALVDSGKVRGIGVSNFGPWDWKLLQKHMRHPLLTNQIEISLLQRQSLVDGTLPAMQVDNLTPMAWSPLAGGQLFQDSATTQRLAPIFKRICEAQNTSADHIALAWLLAHPAQILPIVGTNNPERIKQLSKALDINIDRETWFELWTAAAGQEVP